MSQAAADLEAEFGERERRRLEARRSPTRTSSSRRSASPACPHIHWINRPTFQQVVQIGSFDQFKCYRAGTKKGTTPFAARTVTLADPFETKSTSVLKARTICNPASTGGDGTIDPTAHLACYKIKDTGGQPHFTKRNVVVANAFGEETLSVVKADTLCVPSEQDGVDSALRVDHFKCYRAKPARGTRFVRRTVTVGDTFETKSTIVIKPAAFCTAADKNGEGLIDPTAALTCYKIKDASGQARFSARDTTMTNQFGTDVRTAAKAQTLCVPSVRRAP